MKLKTEKINVKIKKNITIAQKYDKYQKHKKLLKILVGGRGWENPSLPDLPDPTPNSVQFQTLTLSFYYQSSRHGGHW